MDFRNLLNPTRRPAHLSAYPVPPGAVPPSTLGDLLTPLMPRPTTPMGTAPTGTVPTGTRGGLALPTFLSAPRPPQPNGPVPNARQLPPTKAVARGMDRKARLAKQATPEPVRQTAGAMTPKSVRAKRDPTMLYSADGRAVRKRKRVAF